MLHYLDMIDAKMFDMQDALEDLTENSAIAYGRWTTELFTESRMSKHAGRIQGHHCRKSYFITTKTATLLAVFETELEAFTVVGTLPAVSVGRRLPAEG